MRNKARLSSQPCFSTVHNLFARGLAGIDKAEDVAAFVEAQVYTLTYDHEPVHTEKEKCRDDAC